jgi:hypothetical protein
MPTRKRLPVKLACVWSKLLKNFVNCGHHYSSWYSTQWPADARYRSSPSKSVSLIGGAGTETVIVRHRTCRAQLFGAPDGHTDANCGGGDWQSDSRGSAPRQDPSTTDAWMPPKSTPVHPRIGREVRAVRSSIVKGSAHREPLRCSRK